MNEVNTSLKYFNLQKMYYLIIMIDIFFIYSKVEYSAYNISTLALI